MHMDIPAFLLGFERALEKRANPTKPGEAPGAPGQPARPVPAAATPAATPELDAKWQAMWGEDSPGNFEGPSSAKSMKNLGLAPGASEDQMRARMGDLQTQNKDLAFQQAHPYQAFYGSNKADASDGSVWNPFNLDRKLNQVGETADRGIKAVNEAKETGERVIAKTTEVQPALESLGNAAQSGTDLVNTVKGWAGDLSTGFGDLLGQVSPDVQQWWQGLPWWGKGLAGAGALAVPAYMAYQAWNNWGGQPQQQPQPQQGYMPAGYAMSQPGPGYWSQGGY